MKQIEATILGQSYVLACPPGGEMLLLEAVNIVDREMSAIRDAGKVKARDRIAVLASLNLAFDLAAQQAAAAAAPAPVAASPAADVGDADARAAQLIQKLDQALAGDDHLL